MKIRSKNSISQGEHVVGGKTKGLLFLVENQLLTPNFFVIDHNTLVQVEKDKKVLQSLLDNWMATHNFKKEKLWAVRSSAEGEDDSSKSFAGQYKSLVNVNFDTLANAILEVVDSYGVNSDYSEASEQYGIIIQEMLSPKISGVFFTRDPANPINDQAVINVIPGLGGKLVSGEFPGLHIEFKDNVAHFPVGTEIVEGEEFVKGKLIPKCLTVQEIRNTLKPHIDKLLKAGLKLEKIKRLALDFEFAIEGDKLYWLQVRPITTTTYNIGNTVWDNTSIEANYPGKTLPLSISFLQRTLYRSYTEGGKTIGFNTKVLEDNQNLLMNMCGEIEGSLFYNVTAWQTLLFQMPFGYKLSKRLPALWGMDYVPFNPPKSKHSFFQKIGIAKNLIVKLIGGSKYEKEYFQLYDNIKSEFSQGKLITGNLVTLTNSYHKVENELGNNWLAPALNGFYTMVVFSLLKYKVKNSRIFQAHPNFINDILNSEGDVISVKLVHEFQNLLRTINEEKQLQKLFEDNGEETILQKLKTDFHDFGREVFSYIEKYGNRTAQAELKLETIMYQQNPAMFIEYLKNNLKNSAQQKNENTYYDFTKVLNKYYPYNFIQRWIFKILIKSSIKRVKARENFRFMRTETFNIIRHIFLAMGRELMKAKKIKHERDVFYLEIDELLELEKSNGFMRLVQLRKDYYKKVVSSEINRFVKVKEKFIPVENKSHAPQGNEMKGIGCSSGIVEAEVLVVKSGTGPTEVVENRILIANYFEPGWISLFSKAGGVISERGNLLSHTAIICRELNVPSIVGAKGIMNAVKSGDRISMNGSTGVIKFTSDE